MLNSLKKTEIEYVKCFSEYYEDDRIVRFWDDNLPDMYGHNFTFIKDNIPKGELRGIILKELELRKRQSKKFLQIISNFSIDAGIISDLREVPEVSVYDYMYIEAGKYDSLKGNDDCKVVEAVTPEILKDGTEVDIEANALVMGNDFAIRRINKKVQIYTDVSKYLSLYVCYHNGIPIGNCELFLNNNTAKIEDFDILYKYQRKGFGTTVLKHLLMQSKAAGVETAYVITDDADTAKEMYNKCGFSKILEKTELFFNICI